MTRMRSVLVTGATTPLGRALCARLLANGASVLATALEQEASAGHWVSEGVSYVASDLARPRALHDLVFGAARERAVDTVFHLAMHRRFDAEGDGARALNVEALRNLLACCEGHPSIKRVVYRSYADVYRIEQRLPSLVSESHPLEHAPNAPQWLRDRVEADLLACTRMAMTSLEIVVLRMADILAAGTASQLHDYLRSRVCFYPLGFDPMLNLLSLEDAVSALTRAGEAAQVQGVFNIPGKDTLPLRACLSLRHRIAVPLPGPLLSPLYALRRGVLGRNFSYRVNQNRLHFPVVLNGKKAQAQLGFIAEHSALRANSEAPRVSTP